MRSLIQNHSHKAYLRYRYIEDWSGSETLILLFDMFDMFD